MGNYCREYERTPGMKQAVEETNLNPMIILMASEGMDCPDCGHLLKKHTLGRITRVLRCKVCYPKEAKAQGFPMPQLILARAGLIDAE